MKPLFMPLGFAALGLRLIYTVIFCAKVEKPGWTPRWNTKPDRDVTGVPLR